MGSVVSAARPKGDFDVRKFSKLLVAALIVAPVSAEAGGGTPTNPVSGQAVLAPGQQLNLDTGKVGQIGGNIEFRLIGNEYFVVALEGNQMGMAGTIPGPYNGNYAPCTASKLNEPKVSVAQNYFFCVFTSSQNLVAYNFAWVKKPSLTSNAVLLGFSYENFGHYKP